MKYLNGKLCHCCWFAVGMAAVLLSAREVAAQQAVPQGLDTASSSLRTHLLNLSAVDAEVRLEAVRQLGASGNPAAVAPLVETMRNDPDASIRGWAARSLHQLGTAEALVAIQQASQHDPDERVRTLAARLVASSTATATQPQVSVSPSQHAQATLSLNQERRRRSGMRMLIAGYSILGASWLLTGIPVGASLVAQEKNLGWTWFVPIVGPAIYSFKLFSRSDEAYGGTYVFVGAICWFLTVVQGTGLGLLTAGHVRVSRARRESQHLAATRDRWHLLVSPSGPAGSLGATVSGLF